MYFDIILKICSDLERPYFLREVSPEQGVNMVRNIHIMFIIWMLVIII